MRKETAELLKKAADELDIECDLHDSYSGRVMFGEETYGLSFAIRSDLYRMIAYAASTLLPPDDRAYQLDFVGQVGQLCSHDLGRDLIVY